MKRKLTPKTVFAIVCTAIISMVLIVALCMQIDFVIADKIECWHPSYAKEDITEVLRKPELTDDDYGFLYKQTGLTRTGITRALARGYSGEVRIKKIQDDFFEEHKVKNAKYAPYVCTDYIDKYVSNIYLETGDIIVTSSTHISGVRIGHAGLVTDGASETVLQANAYGSLSRLSSATIFNNRANFIVLRPKDGVADTDIKEAVAEYALNNLVGIPYEGLAGLLSDKYSKDKTQCAHLVWYAYNQFGIDLDSNGGPLVTPNDLARSDKLEVVQIFGFDIDNPRW